ncbi:MAG: GGDEF domain-containing protein [Acidobacteria bacterium]|nr:GGDEF domain-containing protein [Acidobacteriota bacterium]
MEPDAKSFSQQLRQRMAVVEKRDWELWVLALTMVAVLAIGLFIVLAPSVFMGQDIIRVQARLSPQLLLGMLVLIMLLLAYLVHKQLQLRALRFQSIQEAWNFQMTHVQLLIDPLTQALNRSALEEILSKEIKRAQRKQTTLVFLYLDINNFKSVNTRYGHLSGDLVLTEVGGILKQCVRGSDYVIRMGGDEFLVALVDTDEPGAEIVKRRIHQMAEKWSLTSPLPGFTLNMSVGVQVFDGSRPFDQVLAEADARMYAEKKKDSTSPENLTPLDPAKFTVLFS